MVSTPQSDADSSPGGQIVYKVQMKDPNLSPAPAWLPIVLPFTSSDQGSQRRPIVLAVTQITNDAPDEDDWIYAFSYVQLCHMHYRAVRTSCCRIYT